MSSLNKCMFIGNLGNDPDVRCTPDGAAIANISLAVNSKYKNKSGETVEETEWVRVTFFGRLAEIVGEYLKKGRSIYVEGRLKTRKYTDKDGVEKYATDIIASEMQMLGSREGIDRAPAARPAGKPAGKPAPSMAEMDDSDIPF